MTTELALSEALALQLQAKTAEALTLQAERDEAVALLHTLMDVAAEASADRQTYDFKPRAESAAKHARALLGGGK